MAVGIRRLEWVTSELCNKLRDGELVRLADVIEQTEGMILQADTTAQHHLSINVD